MEQQPVKLTREGAGIIEESIRSGEFSTAEEVVNEALHRLQGDAEAYPWRVEAFQLLVQVGLDQLDRGEYTELDGPEAIKEFIDEISREVARDGDG